MKRRKISSNISRFVGNILGNALPLNMADITIAALSSETQKRRVGELVTFSNISGITT